MKYRTLRGTDLEVSELGLGCARLGGLFNKSSEAETIALLRLAFDSGVTFYDTADMYAQGESERLLGKAFASGRDRVVIASKVGYELPSRRKQVDRLKPIARPVVQHLRLSQRLSTQMVRGALSQDFSPGRITAALHASLTRLQTDYLDLYMLHGLPAGGLDESLAELERAKGQGLIRHYGVSCETPEDGLRCVEKAGIGVLQVNVSLLHQEARGLIEKTQEKNTGIVARQCYASGLLSRPSLQTDFRHQPPARLLGVRSFECVASASGRQLPELAMKFVNELPGVDVTLVGVRTQAHLEDALAFLAAPPLADVERSAILELERSGG